MTATRCDFPVPQNTPVLHAEQYETTLEKFACAFNDETAVGIAFGSMLGKYIDLGRKAGAAKKDPFSSTPQPTLFQRYAKISQAYDNAAEQVELSLKRRGIRALREELARCSCDAETYLTQHVKRLALAALKRCTDSRKAAQYHEESLAIIAFRSLVSDFIS